MNVAVEPGCIVVGVDGSDDSARAVRWAAEQARLEGRPLAVVSIGHPPPTIRSVGWTGVIEGASAEAAHMALTASRAIVRESMAIAHESAPEVAVQAAPGVGDPRELLIEISPLVEMIVLGSRGRGTIRSMLLGSVSAAVSKATRCPVVVCRRPAHGVGHGVVVGADGTPESLPVLEFAFRQASLRGLPLTVVHCFWDAVVAVAGLRRTAPSPEDLIATDPELAEMRSSLEQSVADLRVKYPDVEASLRLQHGLVDEVLAPHRHPWELVVVGRHPLQSPSRILTGSIATAVVERARGTVAVVPEPGDAFEGY